MIEFKDFRIGTRYQYSEFGQIPGFRNFWITKIIVATVFCPVIPNFEFYKSIYEDELEADVFSISGHLTAMFPGHNELTILIGTETKPNIREGRLRQIQFDILEVEENIMLDIPMIKFIPIK